MSTSRLRGPYGGSFDPCILGYTNGTYPNRTRGQGDWSPFGIYVPTDDESTTCQAANDPFDDSISYGYWTTYFILSGIFAVSVVNWIKKLHNLNRIMRLPSVIELHPKASALFRMVSYPQLRFMGGAIPPLGPFILLFGFLVYGTLVTFLRRPFYRPPNFGSPPLALRAEWVALPMVPWIYAAASKRNFLRLFSGVSFQRIMTFHKWAPWICLFMALVHAGAMIRRANLQGPYWYAIQGDSCYWNGFLALGSLTWLCVMSLGPIRKRFYEAFYVCHILAALLFLIWLYIHVAGELNSWQYMHAATVLWGAAIIWRSTVFVFDHGWFRRIPRGSVELLPAGAIRLTIPVPANRTWSAGSFVYLRFLNIKPWQSHPFTISSLPAPNKAVGLNENNTTSRSHEMVFVIRSHRGMTARLESLATSTPSRMHACLVDGPYGGHMDGLRACDSVLMIAGGTGMSAVAPIAQALGRASVEVGMSRCHTYRVHWVMRQAVAAEWYKDQMQEIEGIEMYVTSGDAEGKMEGNVNKEAEGTSRSSPSFQHGRPNLKRLIRNTAEQNTGRIGVMVCGPDSMALDVRNAVAEIEGRILISDSGIQCSEIELYEESFQM